MKIILKNGAASRNIDAVMSASLRDSLDGELSLSFSLIGEDVAHVTDTTTVEYDGQKYNIASYQKGMAGRQPTCQVTCEHVTLALNDPVYDVEAFAFTNTVAYIMGQALYGTPFTVGTLEKTGSMQIKIEGKASRRQVLTQIAAITGGEIEYNNYAVNLRNHRGRTVPVELLDTDNVVDVGLSKDKRDGVTAYDIALGRKSDLASGDNIHIVFAPLGIDVQSRIIAIEHNPYNPFEVTVEVGQYQPEITDEFSKIIEEISSVRHTFQAAFGTLESHIEDTDGNVSTLSQTISGFSSRLSTAEGNVSTLTQTVNSFGSRIEAAEGNVSTLSQTVSSFDSRISTAEGQVSSISQKVDSLTLSVSNSSTSSTLTLKSGSTTLSSASITFTGVVTFTSLSTAGQATINGANITAGTISAERIDTSSIKLTKVFNPGDYAVVDCSTAGTVTIGGDTSSAGITTTRITATSQIIFRGYSYTWWTMSLDDAALYPNTNLAWKIGKYTNPVYAIYTDHIFIGGTEFIPGNTSQIVSETSASYYVKLTGSSTSTVLQPSGSGQVALGSNSYWYRDGYFQELNFGGSSTACIVANSSRELRPNSTSYSCYLGTSTYQWQAVYTKNLYINGTLFDPGDGNVSQIVSESGASYYIKLTGTSTSMILQPSGSNYVALGSTTYWYRAGYITDLCFGGDASYYIVADSRELRPNSTSTTYPCNLGSSSYPWHRAYLGSMSALICTTSTATLGFFGTTPTARKTVASGADVATLITALKAYGLIA